MVAEYKKHFYNCPICGSKTFLKICGINISDDVCVCRICGIVCLNPRMDEKGYEEYYRNQYFGKYQSEIETKRPYPKIEEDSRAAKIFRDLQKYVSPRSKIIEIGCGKGRNLIIFKENGFNHLTGVEPSADCCRKIEKFYGINYINKTLSEFVTELNEKEKFGCLILSHTLEHFVEPEKALKMIGNIIDTQGIIYIRIPSLSYEYRDSNPFAQFTLPHTFYFTKESLKMLLRNSGFIIERYFKASDGEIVFLVKKANKHLTPIKQNLDEYEKVLSYLKRNKRIYIKVKTRQAIKEFIIKIFGENMYLKLRKIK